MLRLNNLIFLLIFSTYCYSQSDIIDDKYREDQIYIGIYYNSLKNTPGFYSQTQFSSSINLGFIRDIPLNKNRNFGIGIGMGLSTSSYHNNLRFSLIDNQFAADVILDSEPFDKNKWTLNELEFPFEIRWRTSTPENYKFWRVYFGLKTSYIFNSRSKYESASEKQILGNLPFSKIQSGLTLNAGNNTWNLGVYYGLIPLFNDEFTSKYQSFKNIKQFKVGLIFYIF